MTRTRMLIAIAMTAGNCNAGQPGQTYGGSWPEALIIVMLLLIAARGVVNWLDRITRFREK